MVNLDHLPLRVNRSVQLFFPMTRLKARMS
jgi:hypothetical protein